jgi:hypothetical protein
MPIPPEEKERGRDARVTGGRRGAEGNEGRGAEPSPRPSPGVPGEGDGGEFREEASHGGRGAAKEGCSWSEGLDSSLCSE